MKKKGIIYDAYPTLWNLHVNVSVLEIMTRLRFI